MAEQVELSTGTRTRVRRRVEALLAEQHGPGTVPMPSAATFYRLLRALDAGQHTFGAATTRRSMANRPDGPFGTVLAARPGELVQIDTTPIDVMVLLEDGVSARAELTILVDLATRTIGSGLLRPHGTKAVDAALLLARALVPEPMRPGWADALRMRASRLPHTELAAVDDRLADAAAKPVITPETIVCDRGAVFLSETFLAACSRLGISLQPAHPRTPTDKGVVERTFASINTLFCQYVAGYTGRDTTRRGRDVDGPAVWSLAQLQDLFDQWVLAGWQARPHDGLRHPELPRSALSPNEMYAAQIVAAGYLPLALSASDYLELLPVAWRTITAAGIRVGSLTYDSAELNPYRGQLSTLDTGRGSGRSTTTPTTWGRSGSAAPIRTACTPRTGHRPRPSRATQPAGTGSRSPGSTAAAHRRRSRTSPCATPAASWPDAAAILDNSPSLRRSTRCSVTSAPAPAPPRPPRPPAGSRPRPARPGRAPHDRSACPPPAGTRSGTTTSKTEAWPTNSTSSATARWSPDSKVEPLRVVPFGVFDPHAEAKRYW